VGLALAGADATPAAAQGRVIVPIIVDSATPSRTIREDPSPRSRATGFGSVPSASERTRIVTEDGTGRRTRIVIEEAPASAGSGTTRGATGSFGRVPEFDRDIRITTDGAPVETPIIILPRR
jgi:hypothetical protein